MRVVFTEEASADLFESAAYYESREAGLGMRFRGEVATVLQSAAASPQLLRERPEGFRRVDCVNSNTNRHGCVLPPTDGRFNAFKDAKWLKMRFSGLLERLLL